jgi:ribosomal protein S12 methylthiotransferase
MKKNTIYLLTLGCPKNEVDSDLVLSNLLREGFTLAERPEEAAVILVNTCAFIQAATEESIETILDCESMRAPGSRLYVLGCLQERYGAELAELLPEVDGFVAPRDYASLARIVGAGGGEAGRERGFFSGIKRGRIYLKIAEGCDRACSFCTIPSIKGPLRSRPAEEIESEAVRALELGAKELVVVSQDTVAYGRDLGRPYDLAGLLAKLAGLSGDFRIRLMYLQPDGIDERLLLALEHDKICSYLDLPLQHVDGEVLRRMGRRGGIEEYRGMIERIRERIPGIALRSSFITGFPGEDRTSFDRLRDFVEEIRFDWLAVFPFSPEEGTRAEQMPGRCAEKTARSRAESLRELQEEIMREKADGLVGSSPRVLIEGPSEMAPGYSEARSYREAPEVDGLIFVPREEAGEEARFARVEIVRAEGIDLIGRIGGPA